MEFLSRTRLMGYSCSFGNGLCPCGLPCHVPSITGDHHSTQPASTCMYEELFYSSNFRGGDREPRVTTVEDCGGRRILTFGGAPGGGGLLWLGAGFIQ